MFLVLISFYFKGQMSKPETLIEVDDNGQEIDDNWALSFEQFEATMNAETCLVTWLERINEDSPSLETRINRYHQDIQR